MLQDIAPKQYHCEFSTKAPCATDFLLYSNGKDYLMKRSGQEMEFPTFRDTRLAEYFDAQGRFTKEEISTPEQLRKEYGIIRTVAVEDKAFFVTDSKEIFKEDSCFELVPKRTLRHYEPSYIYFGIVTAEQLGRWYDRHKYCGKCGHSTVMSETERAVVCEECGTVRYPQICPAVTISIIHEGKLLLARSKGGSFQKYGQIAGYVEVGETFEETVKREAFEETGLHVKNIKYYKNQPWALTDAHMVGFTAEVDGAAKLTIQESELLDARWFAPNEIPADIFTISLTYEMIENFKKKYGKETDVDLSAPYREFFDVREHT
jgi:NAD+ diphosphatase